MAFVNSKKVIEGKTRENREIEYAFGCMSWEERDMDELFREAADDMHFAYNDAFFEEIEKQLPIRKRRAFYWYVPVLLVLLSGATYVYFSANGVKNEVSPVIGETTGKELPAQKVNAQHASHSEATPFVEGLDQITGGIQQHSFSDLDNQVEPQKRFLSNDLVAIEDLLESPSADEHSVWMDHENENELHESNYFTEKESVTVEGVILEDQLVSETAELNDREISVSVPLVKRNANNLFIEPAFGVGQSFVRSAETGSTRSYVFGLSAGYSKKIGSFDYSASLGIRQQSFNNLKIADRTEIYGFGLTTYDNSYHFKSITFASVGFGVEFNAKRHVMGAQLNAFVPVNAMIQFEEYTNGELKSSGTANVDRNYFRTIIEPSVSYSFELMEGFNVGLKVGAATANPLNSERIQGERVSLPLNGQLILKKKFNLK